MQECKRKLMALGTTTLIISNKEMNDIMKIVQALENSNILLKEVTKTIKNETEEQKGGLLAMLLGTLRVTLLGNMLAAAKGIVRAGSGNKKGKGKGIVRAGYGNEINFLCCLILEQTLKYKCIIRMNQNLMVFFQEIICLKNKGWGLCKCNKP